MAILGLGAVTTALAALPYKAFDLDRYFVPKELALHLTALIAATALLLGARRLALTRVDTLLAAFLALSALSATTATNGWAAARALAVTGSGLAIFWSARSLARAGHGRRLIAGIAAGVAAAAGAALLQAYGAHSDFFSLNRAPGGTLGNRNFVAHLAAIGTPALIFAMLTARRPGRLFAGALGTTVIAAVLVLSRSRAAWLALVVAACVAGPVAWRARSAWLNPVLIARSALLAIAMLAGIIGAVTLPNVLHWKSQSPYLDSAFGVADYREGSGHGRLVQYGNTARLALHHPVLGVGPGNWSVAYPQIVQPGDPSLDRDTGMTENPWPSSDWAAMLAERGVPAFLCLILAFVGLGVEAARATAAADRGGDGMLAGFALLATLAVLCIVGAFDAVLLLPTPSLIGWSLLGTLNGMLEPPATPRITVPLPRPAALALALIVAVAGIIAAARSAASGVAMAIFTDAESTGAIAAAARLDPGSYRIQIRLAALAERRRQCDSVRAHAGRAHALYPDAPEPQRLLAACSITTRHSNPR